MLYSVFNQFRSMWSLLAPMTAFSACQNEQFTEGKCSSSSLCAIHILKTVKAIQINDKLNQEYFISCISSQNSGATFFAIIWFEIKIHVFYSKSLMHRIKSFSFWIFVFESYSICYCDFWHFWIHTMDF